MHIDIPVPHGRGGRVGQGGFQGFSPGQGSTAFSGADLVDIPVPRGGGLHGPVSTASSSHSPGAVDEAFTWFFPTFPQSQKSARLGPHSGSELGADFNPRTPAAYGDSTALEDDESESGSGSGSEVEEDAANEEGEVLEVIEKVPQPGGHVTNLPMLARLHGLEESHLMYWIFEFGEEEGLMRAIDEMLDRLNFETESVASESRGKVMCFRSTYRFLVSQLKR